MPEFVLRKSTPKDCIIACNGEQIDMFALAEGGHFRTRDADDPKKFMRIKDY